ncbi:hypothetical protein C8N43_1816 [Litoreibacter ponti]|uniref:Intracellular septation protein A n=1 Tax=Litoreibacter ponti TaxID=1510457 RepID=A0A2T6BM44_9RHOB|nr:hypothetical protein [Litoreibacter ponti]PTX57150.1 hypothetical protein C8N43_1816 [Litoreibacter ponti]
MRRPLISLYVLLTTPISVPWRLLARGAAIVITFLIARAIEPWTGLGALNVAVLAGLLTTGLRALSPAFFEPKDRDITSAITVACVLMSLSALAHFLPASTLQIGISLGMFAMGLMYAFVLWLDPTMYDRLGWRAEDWGTEGHANAARWQILRCAGLGVAYAYAAYTLNAAEWIVAHAALPLVFYMLFHWSVIATHPYEDNA